MRNGQTIRITGGTARDDGSWESGVEIGSLDFAGWGERQVVPAPGGSTWNPESYAVIAEDATVLMRGEMVEIGGVLTTGDVLAPDAPLGPDEPWHFIVPRPVE